MKGIVFTEFLELVENKFGYEIVDKIITNSKLASNGVYTSIGTYDYREIFTLVEALSKEIEIDVSELMTVYGKHFYYKLVESYPIFFKDQTLFTLLASIDNHIHVEVQKLYPEAELPKFEPDIINKSKMILTYSSERKMADFAKGLIYSAMEHFGVQGKLTSTILDDKGQVVKFEIHLNE